ncbi:MAG: glutathione S-transferase [Pseudomonadales bacterium]|jgi:glutathione S-transferase|nr:glutathione S-transferase [Pseudomonadales bacterium]
MLVLHGTPRSNYVGMVATALHEKGLEFVFRQQAPEQTAAWLARSPMGKVPCLETADGTLTETQVILDYLEAIAPEPALVPSEPFARARLQQLSRIIELYVELPARRLLPAAFFGAEAPAELREAVAAELDRGFAAVRRLARFEPWIAGEAFTQTDIVWHFTMGLADRIAAEILGRDLLAEIPAAAAHREAVEARASLQRWRALS